MAYYAFVNENKIVTAVVPGRDEDEIVDGITSIMRVLVTHTMKRAMLSFRQHLTLRGFSMRQPAGGWHLSLILLMGQIMCGMSKPVTG
jgi:hypothetical protein